jgi:hypothetical protein
LQSRQQQSRVAAPLIDECEKSAVNVYWGLRTKIFFLAGHIARSFTCDDSASSIKQSLVATHGQQLTGDMSPDLNPFCAWQIFCTNPGWYSGAEPRVHLKTGQLAGA